MDTLSLSPVLQFKRIPHAHYQTILNVIRAIDRAADTEADFYTGQTPVEDWALYALLCIASNDFTKAQAVLDTWQDLPWSENDGDSHLYRSEFNWTDPTS